MVQMNTTPATAKTEPTERSTSPLVIKSACPMAITPIGAATRSTLGIEFSQAPSVLATKNSTINSVPMTTPVSTRPSSRVLTIRARRPGALSFDLTMLHRLGIDSRTRDLSPRQDGTR